VLSGPNIVVYVPGHLPKKNVALSGKLWLVDFTHPIVVAQLYLPVVENEYGAFAIRALKFWSPVQTNHNKSDWIVLTMY
jgi:hypothetical protein